MDPGWGQRDVGWAALLVLFAASLVTVLGWLLQYARGLWLSRAGGGQDSRPTSASEPGGSLRELGVWRSLLRLRATRTGASEEAGVRGLLASLFAFKSFRENWQRAWVRALNEQACRDGVSLTESLCLSFSFAPAREEAPREEGWVRAGDQLESPIAFSDLSDQRKASR